MMRPLFALGCGLLLGVSSGAPPQVPDTVSAVAPGTLPGTTDIGSPLKGASQHEGGDNNYRLSGGGYDVWGSSDHFRFTWQRLAGDATLSADVHIEAPVANSQARGMLMFRQSLDPGSPYADLVLEANGHAALQFRRLQGGETRELPLSDKNPTHLRLLREGNRFTAYALNTKGREAGKSVSVTLPLTGVIYVGLGVCSHNAAVLQNVTFSAVDLTQTPPR